MEVKDKLFLLRSELRNTRGDHVDHCSFERLLNIRFLRETGRNATVYNEEFRMNFYSPSSISSIYEIETVDFFMKASSRLSKAQEFIRRINYRYDWMQAKIKDKNLTLSVENIKELQERWPRLKAAILKDYKGSVVEHALSEIDKQFETPEGIYRSLSQYFYFGLIFPCIPKVHNENWNHQRNIEFSDYENEKFEEIISYIQTNDGKKLYKITGNTLTDSITTIHEYDGYMNIQEDDTFPTDVKVNITFERDNIINQWKFNLLRYN
ncbi:hypothetical protein [Dysgonomonas sp. 25]|uniref:hypothetical protein n=1 Tax=Dysgonomonas sp. 25 TaxID=2302933 RepID=UPI0013D26269|nr:hypothetical protein [Dysgonomonas sp. 25]NDV67902.1 hypothetical protein [Dysgonomonas sp. 25]